MEASQRQVHMGTQTDGPVKRAHAPRRSHLTGSTVTVCLLPGQSWVSVPPPTNCFQSLVSKPLGPYGFHWLYIHLPSKQARVSKVAALIAAITDHQLESDKVAISSQQFGAIICRCWHFSFAKNEFSFAVALVVGCLLFLVFVRLVLVYPVSDLPSAGTPHVSWQKRSGLFSPAACVRCIWNRNRGSWMRPGAVGGSFIGRWRVRSQPTHEWVKYHPLDEIIWKKRIPGQYFFTVRGSGLISGADLFRFIV